MSTQSARIWVDGAETHIDVRGLGPPEPMVAILSLLEDPDTIAPVIVHHDRDPQPLYPELAERGWDYEFDTKEPGYVRLRLARQS